MMIMEICRAQKDDITGITSLQQLFIAEQAEKYGHEFYALHKNAATEWSSWLGKKLPSQDFALFIAKEENEFIGYISGWIEQRPPIYQLSNIGYISNLYISPAFRGKGVGRKLNETLLVWFKEKGIQHAELVVDSKAEDTIHAFFSMGYKEVQKRLRRTL